MADILISVNGIFDKRYRDMGDGTLAEVVYVGGLEQPLTETELSGLVLDVLLASNPGVEIGDVGLLAGDEIVGDVGIDQTDPGETNKVVTDPTTATPTVYNKTLTVADTEYSQAMPANCRRFEFQCRTEATIRFSNVTGKVAGPAAPWMTLKAGDYYDSGMINQGGSPSTIYLASSVAGTIVELISWI